jgi:hypothetical protein
VNMQASCLLVLKTAGAALQVSHTGTAAADVWQVCGATQVEPHLLAGIPPARSCPLRRLSVQPHASNLHVLLYKNLPALGAICCWHFCVILLDNFATCTGGSCKHNNKPSCIQRSSSGSTLQMYCTVAVWCSSCCCCMVSFASLTYDPVSNPFCQLLDVCNRDRLLFAAIQQLWLQHSKAAA